MVNRKEKKMTSNPFTIYLTEFPKAQQVSELTQEVRVLATKPCYLSSNTGILTVERKNYPLAVL